MPLVLHVDTERGWRGGEQQVLALAGAQRRRGTAPIIAARAGGALAERAARDGFEVAAVAPLSELALIDAARLRGIIRQRGIEIVHAHAAHSVALAALATRGTRARLVVTRHVEFPLRRNRFTRWKYGRADAIVAISDAAARALVSSGITSDRITVIQGGIDLTAATEPASRATLQSLGVPDGAPLIVLVAALTAEKEPRTFVRAVARSRQRVPNAQALVVGEGPERAAAAALARELGLGDVVRFAGFRDDARQLLAAASVAVLTSRNEGLPVVVLEALAAGTPFVSTNAGGIAEVVRDDVEGFIRPIGDADAIGDAIALLLSDDALHSRMSAAARRRATEYSIDRTAERLDTIYARVLSTSR